MHQFDWGSTLKIQKGEEFKIIFDCLFFLAISKMSRSQTIKIIFVKERKQMNITMMLVC